MLYVRLCFPGTMLMFTDDTWIISLGKWHSDVDFSNEEQTKMSCAIKCQGNSWEKHILHFMDYKVEFWNKCDDSANQQCENVQSQRKSSTEKVGAHTF